ncbi:cryptochrome/photolyase family protein [Dyadobacter beijingensis]|uniref:Cryptochrome/photolyase family protein n=1 Tax=Dyadobacter beijingensis TaxID=365489 RepID=A0ABQ2IH19_9BACT|nr:cryptochrome/photolyase family protein [Dyadobacter beijingensis]GGN11083.1 cryptochrome/photolyase family protein [Dyadobacter beijingensis]
MKAVTLVFPHQLFQKHPAIEKDRPVVMVEEALFFRQFYFHKQKLLFHRATMQNYKGFLEEHHIQVEYVDAQEKHADVRKLPAYLAKKGFSEIHFADVTDDWLSARLRRAAAKAGMAVNEYPSPMFLLSKDELDDYFMNKRRYFMADFYAEERKKRDILIVRNGEPAGGKWSFDDQNRLKFPKKQQPPEICFPRKSDAWEEAREYVDKHFAENYGQISDEVRYPVSFAQSHAWLDQFLEKRFSHFGPYEDAIVSTEHFLHHSVLSPILNAGLITPQEVVQKALAYAHEHHVPLNSLEGFIRQIIGWREFVRGVYQIKGSQQRTRNYWQFKRKLPESFWNASTGIAPLDITIQKVLDTGYCHHIERLMVMGNFMMLCEIDPDDAYRWFMELFIDAYDWVMVPNVYGMSQFSDGGLMVTKPYISASNYLLKMSDFPKGEWQETWDGLFWRFMDKYRKFFLRNPRLGMLLKTFDQMPEEKKQAHIRNANTYLRSLER